MAAFESYIQRTKIKGTTCILDLGHNTTKAYLFNGETFISNHFSHIAGKLIDETISQNYQIGLEEAISYKHANCFVLTDTQFEQVEKEQQEFAFLMKKTLWPLILKIKQWKIGFKAITGQKVDKILLTGGTSQIKNLDNFLSFFLSMEVHSLDPFEKKRSTFFGIEPENQVNFSLPFLMVSAQTHKPPLPNFLIGVYSSEPEDRISLYNISFMTTRSIILMVIIVLLFILENVTLKKEEKRLDRKLLSMLKTPALNINSRQRRSYKKRPESILKLIKTRNQTTEKNIKNLQHLKKIDAVTPLANLSQVLGKNLDIEMINYKYENEVGSARFRGKSEKKVQEFHNSLKAKGVKKEEIRLNLPKKEIIVRKQYKED